MTDDTGRPQDQGRKHRRGGSKLSAETTTLLAESYAAMRRDLRRVLVHTRGRLPDPGLLDDGGVELEPIEPSVAELTSWWNLGRLLMTMLGTEVDDKPTDARAAEPSRPARRRVDFGRDPSSKATTSSRRRSPTRPHRSSSAASSDG